MQVPACARCGVAVAFGVAALVIVTPARAVQPPTIYDNYQTFPVGSRAAGMGGAYTALSCDEAALHYNPAALACAGASRLELAANAYIIDSMSVPNAFGRGEDVSATTYHSIPSIVGGVRILGEGDPVDQTGRFAFGLAVSVPRSLAIKADPSSARRSFLKYRGRDDLTAGDIGLGYQVNRWLALGVSIGAALRTSDSSTTTLYASQDADFCGDSADQAAQGAAGAPPCHGFVLVTDDLEILALGARAKAGVRITPNPNLAFGFMVVSPTVDIYGSAREFITVAFAVPTTAAGDPLSTAIYDAAPTVYEGSSDLSLPMRIAAGVAYMTRGFTVSLDVSLNLPRDVEVAYDMNPRDIEGVDDPGPAPDTVLHRSLQPNVNVGIEFALLPSLVLDLGAFTDLSSVGEEDVNPPKPPAGESAPAPADRVHMFGGTVALGILSTQSRGWFGLSFEMGQADARVLSGDLTLESLAATLATGDQWSGRSTITRWTLAGTIGSNYSFLPDKPAPKPPPRVPAAPPVAAPPAAAPPPPAAPAPAEPAPPP
jgi:hypothetical protein